MTLEKITVDGLDFMVRPDTSDEKAIREVVVRRGYGRYGFTPAEDEFWIDLGANVGAFSVWAASQHDSITVHAYEADPDMCELTERNAKLNGLEGQISIFHSAVVADRRKTVTLHCNTARGNVWRNSIEKTWRGGEDITVPAYPISKVLNAVPKGTYLKMDIEGTEMPILEWMLEHPRYLNILQGMVFEWSFDVDRRIARFVEVVMKLRDHYSEVRNAQLPEDCPEEWPGNWQPPCRVVWAWND